MKITPIHYSKILSPTQSIEMKTFLNALIRASTKCKQAGVKPDISAAIVAWSGTVKSDEERSTESTWAYREKHGLCG